MIDIVTLILCDVSLGDLEIEYIINFDRRVLSIFVCVILLEYMIYSLKCYYEAIAISNDSTAHLTMKTT